MWNNESQKTEYDVFLYRNSFLWVLLNCKSNIISFKRNKKKPTTKHYNFESTLHKSGKIMDISSNLWEALVGFMLLREVLWKFKFGLLYGMFQWGKLERFRASYILLTTEYSEQSLLQYSVVSPYLWGYIPGPQGMSGTMGGIEPCIHYVFPTPTFLR